MNSTQQAFLARATAEAVKANHPFPIMAACEAAVESSWGNSALARDANNLFGTKQHVHPVCGTINLPTNEFLDGKWVRCNDVAWVKYPDWRASFCDRLATLERLANKYPHYAAALRAKDARAFVSEVSRSWSTDPGWQCGICGKTFLREGDAVSHESEHAGAKCDRVPGLGRALKVISIYEDYMAGKPAKG